MLINFLCRQDQRQNAVPSIRSRTGTKANADLWRTIFFTFFVLGVFVQRFADDRFGELLSSYAAVLRIRTALSVPVWIALFFSASFFGRILLPPLCFFYGIWLAECAACLWRGVCWAGEHRAFFFCAAICVPSFYLLCMQGARVSGLIRETAMRSGQLWKDRIGGAERSLLVTVFVFLVLIQTMRLF